jgi:hypothetical protein
MEQQVTLPPSGFIRLQVEAYGLFRFITLVDPQTRVGDLKKGLYILNFSTSYNSNITISIDCRDSGIVRL